MPSPTIAVSTTLRPVTPSGITDFGSYGFNGGTAAAAVPEPGTLLLLGIGLVVVGVRQFRA